MPFMEEWSFKNMTITPELVKRIIDENLIYIEFQPIYSLNTKKIIGVEALARGSVGDVTIPPEIIFEYSKQGGFATDADRLCRSTALSEFKTQHISENIYINLDVGNIGGDIPHSEILREIVSGGIPAENIVIELCGSRVKDTFALMNFADSCRKFGFIIALDNVISGYDALNLISLVGPDIVKIDRSVIAGIADTEDRQEAFKLIIRAAKKIGALTVAVGTETVEEVITCMLLGADYFQGYYFSRPDSFNHIYSNEARVKLEAAARKLNMNIKNNPTAESVRIETYKRIIYNLVSRLAGTDPDGYTQVLLDYLRDSEAAECAFLIDSHGFQITPTVLADFAHITPGYSPALLGENHSIKNYYYAVREQIEDPFISSWYTSGATGNRCKTISSKFYSKDGNMIVVCADVIN
jgi:EAL domain-containing protein (putative c-di-GMP-specific phosphodiesterase class I)